MTSGIITLRLYDECRYAERHVLFIVILNVIMLSVVKLNVVILSAIQPKNDLNLIPGAYAIKSRMGLHF
jgi:hypothetical protein